LLGILLVLSTACKSGGEAQRGRATAARDRLSQPASEGDAVDAVDAVDAAATAHAVDAVDAAALVEAADAVDPADPVDEVAPLAPEDPSELLFVRGLAHPLDLQLDPLAWRALGSMTPTDAEVPGTLRFDGGLLPAVNVSLRGRFGSYQPVWQRPKWKLDLNDLAPDRRLFGQEALALNNAARDCSYLRDVGGLELFARAGVPTPRTGWARLRVNGADHGLHPMPEWIDDRFLRRHWASPDGNLYDGKYVLDAEGDSLLLDFRSSTWMLFDLEEGTDVGLEDIHAITLAAEAHYGQPTWMEATGALVDWPEILRFLAAELVAGQVDGYTLNRNNYFVYFDPADGKAELIPWDLDTCFLFDEEWGVSWERPIGILAHGCLTDPGCAAAWESETRALVATLEAEDFDGWIAEEAAFVRAQLPTDPREGCTADRIALEHAELQARLPALRAAALDFWSAR
jgi:hypothetical protein